MNDRELLHKFLGRSWIAFALFGVLVYLKSTQDEGKTLAFGCCEIVVFAFFAAGFHLAWLNLWLSERGQ